MGGINIGAATKEHLWWMIFYQFHIEPRVSPISGVGSNYRDQCKLHHDRDELGGSVYVIAQTS